MSEAAKDQGHSPAFYDWKSELAKTRALIDEIRAQRKARGMKTPSENEEDDGDS